MKLTWFGGSTMRVHAGGAIVVFDATEAPAGIESAELVSGADLIVAGFCDGLQRVELPGWSPRKPTRLLDAAPQEQPVEVWQAGSGVALVDALGEPPLLLLAGDVPALGRWADGAVVVLFGDGEQLVSAGRGVLEQRAPKLLALAADEASIDFAITLLQSALDGTALVALEPSMALEA